MGIWDWLRGKRKGPEKGKVVSMGGSEILQHGSAKEDQFGFADVPEHWAELRERHYEQHLGPCLTVLHEIMPVVPHLDVYVYPPSEIHGRSHWTLLTGGMSDMRMTLPDGVPPELGRAELMLCIPHFDAEPGQVDKSWEAGWLKYLARLPFRYETWLCYGHTIPNGNPPEPFAEGSLLTTALLVPPVGMKPGFEDGLSLDGEQVNIWQLVLLTDAECEYKLAKGTDALLDLLNRKRFRRCWIWAGNHWCEMRQPGVVSPRLSCACRLFPPRWLPDRQG